MFPADRVRIAAGSHDPLGHPPGHTQRFRGRHRVRPVPVRAAHGQQPPDPSDRAHVRWLQGVHVLPVLGHIHCTHRTPGPHDRRPFGRNAAVRLSQARVPSQVLLHRRAGPAHARAPGTGRAGQREFITSYRSGALQPMRSGTTLRIDKDL